MPGSKHNYHYLFGPVASRRLGWSLGIDAVPYKTCTLDCIYCELGATTEKTVERRPLVPAEQILQEVESFLESGVEADYLTFSGSGEPTLNRDLGMMIREVKKLTSIPVSILTNATLFSDPGLRKELEPADLVLPSLDAVTPGIFRRINRPHPSLGIEEIIGGLRRFREEFAGEIWLEVLLVEGINDSEEELEKLGQTALSLRPERIQLNTVARPGAEADARPLKLENLERIRNFFGPGAEVVADLREMYPGKDSGPVEEKIIAILSRRPISTGEIAATTGLKNVGAKKILTSLLDRGRIRLLRHEKEEFWSCH